MEDRVGYDDDHMANAKRLNTFGIVLFLGIVAVFNAIFWTLSLNAYAKDANDYMRESWEKDLGPDYDAMDEGEYVEE